MCGGLLFDDVEILIQTEPHLYRGVVVLRKHLQGDGPRGQLLLVRWDVVLEDLR
jgi:hypothetical protein